MSFRLPYAMDRRPEDESRLLRSARTSEDDLEGLRAQDANDPSPYVSIVDGVNDSPRSSFPDYKRRDGYRVRSPIRSFRKTGFSFKHAGYTLGILTLLLMALVLGASLSPRENMVTTDWMQTSPTFVKPEGVKVVGLIFCQSSQTDAMLQVWLLTSNRWPPTICERTRLLSEAELGSQRWLLGRSTLDGQHRR